MDLKKLAISKEGVIFKPIFVDGSEPDIEFLVVGRNSDQYRKVQGIYAKELAENKDKAFETSMRYTIEIVKACVVDWGNIDYDDIENLPCTAENKEMVFADSSFKWLVEQIDKFIHIDKNFLSTKTSSKN